MSDLYKAFHGDNGQWGVEDQDGAILYEADFDTSAQATFVAFYHNDFRDAEWERDVMPVFNQIFAQPASQPAAVDARVVEQLCANCGKSLDADAINSFDLDGDHLLFCSHSCFYTHRGAAILDTTPPVAVDAGLGSPMDALRWISANVTDEQYRELLSRLVTDYAVMSGNLQELFRDEPATGGKPVDAIAELVKLERDDLKRQLAAATEQKQTLRAQNLRMKILCFQATRLLSDDHAGQPTREEIKRLRDEIMSYATPPPAPDMSALVEAVQPFLDVASDIDEIGWPDEHIVISMPDPDKSVGILGSHLRVSDFLKLAQAALASAKQPSSAPDVRALAEARKWLDVVDSDLEAIEMGMTGDLTHANVATIARANLAKLAAALAEQDGSAK